MFIGALLVCASLHDATSCEVRLQATTLYNTKQECVADMQGAAQYAVVMLNKNAKPYCFPLGGANT